MISTREKAVEFLLKYNEVDAICQATQCLVLAPDYKKSYWWDVIEKIKHNGSRPT